MLKSTKLCRVSIIFVMILGCGGTFISAQVLQSTLTSSSKSTPLDGVSSLSSGSSTTDHKAKISTTVDISVLATEVNAETTEGYIHFIEASEVEHSAGTFGDPSRFLQTLAGVVSDNDQRNDFLVRGGNPSENLFVIDNIEVPSINQLALSDTTGGMFSMLDNNSIQGIILHTDAYDERFDQRLSSVLEVSTRTDGDVGLHRTMELGIAGAGGSMTRPIGDAGSLFVSVRQGVLQYVTNDIGMNGVPHYRNAFIRAQSPQNEHDSFWGISLTGVDSIQIRPSATDGDETNPFDIDYSGWRNTTGVNWLHVFSARAYGVASVALAMQHQGIQENGQIQNGLIVYNENTTDHISTAKYDWVFQPRNAVILAAGGRVSVDQINYAVAQPIGLQNPYSESPDPLNAMGFERKFAPASSAAYIQTTFNLRHDAHLVLGGREEQWALGGHAGSTGKALFSMPVLKKMVHVGYAEYQQLPSTLYLLSFNNLQTLKPIRSAQLTAGVLLADNSRFRMTIEAYNKNYTDYPVATNYPQLSLANIADTFGQAFLMFPMVTGGKGLDRGVEFSVESHVTSHLSLSGNLSYARSLYSGLDGILRRGNYDIPLQANILAFLQIGPRTSISGRYAATSGVPYTPDNMTLSYAQDRDVYDLTRVNALRAEPYSRLDCRFEQSYRIGLGEMTLHAGLENALNKKNFYQYVWEPHAGWGVGALTEQTQMSIFPDGGVKYSF
jgi:hypothetical protein